MPKAEREKCKGKTLGGNGWLYYPCENNAQPGSDWCKIHDPAVKAAKQKAREEKWEKKWAKRKVSREAVEHRQKVIETQSRLGIELAQMVFDSCGDGVSNLSKDFFAKARELLDASKV